MIKSFRHRGLKRLWEMGDKKGVPVLLVPRIERILDMLDAASGVLQLNLPGLNLHRLKGDRKGEWSVWVNGNQRITFKFLSGDAHDVNLEDYH